MKKVYCKNCKYNKHWASPYRCYATKLEYNPYTGEEMTDYNKKYKEEKNRIGKCKDYKPNLKIKNVLLWKKIIYYLFKK